MSKQEYVAAIGRRKETTASMKLYSKGTGKFTVITANGSERTIQDYFGGNKYMLDQALMPLDVLGGNYRTQFDATIKIAGGGLAGHADAIKLAFARALTERNPELRLTLKPYNLLQRDPRVKERKKPGLKKARKRPTWSKR